MTKYNLLLAVAMFIFAVAVISLSNAFPPIIDRSPGPGFWPKVLSYILAGLALVLFLQNNRRSILFKLFPLKEKDNHAFEIDEIHCFNSQAMKRVYAIILAVISYVSLLALAGFSLATLISLPVIMLIMGEKRPKHIILVSSITTTALYLLFVIVFKMPLPNGFIIPLLGL